MIPFDPENPYPKPLRADALAYKDAQAHAAEVDAWIGLDTERVERELRTREVGDGEQLWIGLGSRALQTPYTEFRGLMERLDLASGQTIVDLGAGYGRLGFVVGRHHPELNFVGYELVNERVVEALKGLAKFDHPRVRMIQADLASGDFRPVDADAYFIYDYGSREAIEKTLSDLRDVATRRAIIVVGRGRASRDAIERGEPWLSQVVPPEHFDHYSIYRSAFSVPALPID